MARSSEALDDAFRVVGQPWLDEVCAAGLVQRRLLRLMKGFSGLGGVAGRGHPARTSSNVLHVHPTRTSSNVLHRLRAIAPSLEALRWMMAGLASNGASSQRSSQAPELSTRSQHSRPTLELRLNLAAEAQIECIQRGLGQPRLLDWRTGRSPGCASPGAPQL